MNDNEIRHRKSVHVQDTVKRGMSRLENVVSDSVMRFRLMPSRVKIIVGISAIFSLCFYLYVAHWIFKGDSEKQLEHLLETEKCPACFGASACGLFYYNQIKMTGMSNYRMLDMMNGKNVHFGYMDGEDHGVVVKKLATDSELINLDKRLCKDAMRPEGCDIARVIIRTNMAVPLHRDSVTPNLLKSTGGFMFYCPSYRLVDRMWSYFKEYKKKNEIFLSDKMQILYMALLNPEPLMIQTFPRSEGWPFPDYIGSCGRVVVENNAGKPLSEFFYSSFEIRAGLAYELMLIAQTLTTKSDFALYLTDASYENFAVDTEGKVTVVDTENVIVVDKLAIEAKKPKGWQEPHEALFSECDGKNCLLFSTDELCTHVNSDHNYNAICRNLLSSYATENNLKGGLLHDMPPEAEDYWELGNLLEECANPKEKEGRWKVKDKLIQALEYLKDGRKEHLLSVEEKERLKRKNH